MEDVKTRIDMTAICALVAADIASRFGHCVDATPSDISHKGETSYATMEIEQSFGVFAMVIASAELHLRAAVCSDGSIWVPVDLRYKHVTGGSNGSTVGTWWIRDGVIETFKVQ
jgi:hypothetical protein